MDGAPRSLVSDYMTASPLPLSPEDSLVAALETMRLRGVRHIPETLYGTRYGAFPVVSDGREVGILTDSDLVRALVGHLRRSKTDEEA